MQVWVEGARPRTLPAAVAPVLVGTALARGLDPLLATLAMVVALALQVAVNYANDYFDGVAGVDTHERTGPRRMVASGLVAPTAMRRAIVVALAVACLAGLALAALVGWELLLVGLLAVLATLGYSGGSRPYASLGLGELFVFVFFGLVATAGTTWVMDQRLGLDTLVAGTAMGALATALLVVNNLRDVPTDEAAGKRTLAVRLGDPATRRLWTGLVVVAALAVGLLAVLRGAPLVALAVVPPLLLLRGAGAGGAVRAGADGRALVPVLEATARTQLAVAVMIVLGLLLDGLGVLS